MAESRPPGSTSGRRIVLSPPYPPRTPGPDRRPAPLQARPAPRPPRPVTWSVFAIDGKSFVRVDSGLSPERAITKARQFWAAEQDNNGDRDFAPGLHCPAQELAEQEVREVNRWILDGKPKPWDYD